MRTFEHFPKESLCKVCKTNEDRPCILVPISRTGYGRISEATPIHEDCIKLTWQPDLDVLIQRCWP